MMESVSRSSDSSGVRFVDTGPEIPFTMYGFLMGKVVEWETGEDSEFEILSTFRTLYPGWCNVDPEHRIRRDQLVGKLQRASNPLVPVTGMCCKACMKGLPKAE